MDVTEQEDGKKHLKKAKDSDDWKEIAKYIQKKYDLNPKGFPSVFVTTLGDEVVYTAHLEYEGDKISGSLEYVSSNEGEDDCGAVLHDEQVEEVIVVALDDGEIIEL